MVLYFTIIQRKRNKEASKGKNFRKNSYSLQLYKILYYNNLSRMLENVHYFEPVKFIYVIKVLKCYRERLVSSTISLALLSLC